MVGVFELVKKRIVWLIEIVVAGMLSFYGKNNFNFNSNHSRICRTSNILYRNCNLTFLNNHPKNTIKKQFLV